MNVKKIFNLGIILTLSFCLRAAVAEAPAEKASATPEAFVARQIRPGDTLKISIWKYSDLNANLVVGPDGYISYLYLGDILVAGKTVEELRQIIAEKLDQKYVANPRVDIQLETQLPTIFVVGEVVKPGSYPYQSGLDPIKAVALAGGFTDFASFNALVIRRGPTGKDVQIQTDLKKLMKATADREEYLLQPGDMVVVKRSWF